MHEAAAEHWLKIAKAKVRDLKKATAELLSNVGTSGDAQRDEKINNIVLELGKHTRTLGEHYEPGPLPQALTSFQTALGNWDGARNHLPYLLQLVATYWRLDDITAYDGNPPTSLDSIISKYRNDQDLEKTLVELVEKLRELVNIADDTLTAQAAS